MVVTGTTASQCEPLDDDELPFSSIRFFFELNDTLESSSAWARPSRGKSSPLNIQVARKC
jgi:hypothetical protein